MHAPGRRVGGCVSPQQTSHHTGGSGAWSAGATSGDDAVRHPPVTAECLRGRQPGDAHPDRAAPAPGGDSRALPEAAARRVSTTETGLPTSVWGAGFLLGPEAGRSPSTPRRTPTASVGTGAPPARAPPLLRTADAPIPHTSPHLTAYAEALGGCESLGCPCPPQDTQGSPDPSDRAGRSGPH